MENVRFDHGTALEHLQLAQWHVHSGSRLVQRQREIVSRLERDEQPAEEARMRLSALEQSQLARIAHRDRIAATLGATAYSSGHAEQELQEASMPWLRDRSDDQRDARQSVMGSPGPGD